MTRPLLTVVIPTIGRSTLPRTLESIPPNAGIEVIVVADAFEADEFRLPNIQSAAREYRARYLEVDAGFHDWGSPQLQAGYALAEGQWIMNCGDDDVYEPLAFPTIERAIDSLTEPVPLMFRTVLHPAPQRGTTVPVVLWHTPEITRGLITGQCFAVPNVPEKLGRWVDDVTFMAETVEAWGGNVGWRTEVISQCY